MNRLHRTHRLREILLATSPRRCSKWWLAGVFVNGAMGRRAMSVRPENLANMSTSSRVGEDGAAREHHSPTKLPSALAGRPFGKLTLLVFDSPEKVTIQRLQQMRDTGTPIAMLTAYDYPTGRACEAHGVDITLVGDSLAQVCLGYRSTTSLTLSEMVHHCAAVARGSHSPFLIADMPFGSYYAGEEDAVRAAVKLVQEGGVDGVKMEGGEEVVGSVRRLVSMGIPVMAHVGLLPQRHTSLSGYRVQGRTSNAASAVLQSALALQDAGAFSMVLEAIPSNLGSYITQRLEIPTIGIGAGVGTSGQVLVWDDVMGTWNGHKARFVRRFANVQAEMAQGVREYIRAVKEKSFPDEAESYGMDEDEWHRFLSEVEPESRTSPPAQVKGSRRIACTITNT